MTPDNHRSALDALLDQSITMAWPEQLALLVEIRDPQTKDDRIRECESLLVRANLRYAFLIARRFAQRSQNPLHAGMDLLVSGACEGLLIAIRKFDPARGCRLTTVVTWWVSQVVHRVRQANQGSWAGHLPAHSGSAEERHKESADAAHRARLPAMSLDAPLPGTDDSPFSDFIGDPSASIERLETAHELAQLDDRINTLFPARTREILLRTVARRETLDAVGKDLGVTRERVRQIQVKSLAALQKDREARRAAAGQKVLAARRAAVARERHA